MQNNKCKPLKSKEQITLCFGRSPISEETVLFEDSIFSLGLSLSILSSDFSCILLEDSPAILFLSIIGIGFLASGNPLFEGEVTDSGA